MVTSAYKALPAYSQAALVLARTQRLDPARLERAFDATSIRPARPGRSWPARTPPRALLERDGEALCARLLRCVAAARGSGCARFRGSSVLEGQGSSSRPSSCGPAGSATGAHGYAVEDDLIAAGMPVEMAGRDVIGPIVTLADDESQVSAFIEVLIAAIERHRSAPRHPVPAAAVDGHAADRARPQGKPSSRP